MSKRNRRQSKQQGGERRNINDPAVVLALRGGNGDGTYMSPETATQLSAVFACQRIIAESLAMLPLILYRRDGKNRLPATENPLYRVLHMLANPEMTSFDLRSTLMGHVVRRGNGFAQIVRNGLGQIIELYPLVAGFVRLTRDARGELFYTYTRPDGSRRVFRRDEIFHIRGLSGDGLVGYSPISEARLVFQTARVMDEYGYAFYDNGGRPGGVLETPDLLDDGAADRMRDSWKTIHGGSKNAGNIAILEQGTKYTPISVAQADQQFIEQKKMSREEIAAIFRVPPHMINSMERATFSSVEEMNQEFIDYTLGPWLVQWEQTIFKDLLDEEERQTHYAKHTVQALLRGNNQSRGEFYAKGLQWGWTNINEVRELEEMNPIQNGDSNFVPLNMLPVDQVVKGQVVQPATSQRGDTHCTCGSDHRFEQRAADDGAEKLRVSRVRLANAQKPVFEDAAKRMVVREVRDVMKYAEKLLKKRSTGDFLAWLNEYYRTGDFTDAVKRAFKPILTAYSAQVLAIVADELGKDVPESSDEITQFVDEYASSLADSWSAGSRQQIEALIDENQSDPYPVVEQRLTEWDTKKAPKVADQHGFEALNALAVAAYSFFAVSTLRWVASGKSCPFCQSLNGKTVSMGNFFIEAGASIDGGATHGIMNVQRNTRHAPLHQGCDCICIAA